MHNVRDQYNRLASHERPCRLPVLDQTQHDQPSSRYPSTSSTWAAVPSATRLPLPCLSRQTPKGGTT